MDEFLKNKKIIIMCFIIIVVFLIINYILNKENNVNYSYNYDSDVGYLKSYEVNEYIPIYVEEADVVIKYLNDFKNSMISNPEVSFNLLNEEYRNKRFGNLGNYLKYIDNILSLSTYSMEVETYKVINSNGNKYFNVYDKEGYHYIFKENSIMNYEVYLDNYTVKID